jgi:hypothetical protein
MTHPASSSPNGLRQLSHSLHCYHRYRPLSLFFSLLAPSLVDLAIVQSFGPYADPDFLGSSIASLAQYLLALLGFSLNVIACALHSQEYPAPWLVSRDHFSLLLVHLQHGRKVPHYDLCASRILQDLQFYRPLGDLGMRPWYMTPIHDRPLSAVSFMHCQVHDAFALAIIPSAVLSGSVVNSIFQPLLIYNIFRVCSITLFCAPQPASPSIDFGRCSLLRAPCHLPPA